MPRIVIVALLLPMAACAAEPITPLYQQAFDRTARLGGFLAAADVGKLRPVEGVAGGGVLVLAEKNKRYAVYAPAGGRLNVKVPAGTWRVREYNPRNGEWGKKRDETADDRGLTLKFVGEGDWAAVIERD